MKTETVRLIDATGRLVAVARVAATGGRYEGDVDLSGAAPEVQELFQEFEEVVNDQIFSFLDDVQSRIADLGVVAVFDDQSRTPVKDLQIYPASAGISFESAGSKSHTSSN